MTTFPAWFLVLGLFLPRIALLAAYIGGGFFPHLMSLWFSVPLAALVPRVLILIAIATVMGICPWFWIHLGMMILIAILSVSRSRSPLTQMTEESSIMVKCDCHGEALQVTHWPNKGEPDEFWFSIWKQGFDNRLCWRERFRWCWNILRTGKPWGDNIIMPVDRARLVANFINDHLPPTI